MPAATPMPEPEPDSKRLILGKYELGRLLGRGATSKVYHARDVATGQSVALKCVSKQVAPESDIFTCINREVAALRRLRHPHVVGLHEILATRRNVYLVMEHAAGGELFDRIATKGFLAEPLARRYFRQLVSAVGYCHSRGVFHRDLKPENLLLTADGTDLKVSDFGLSAAVTGSPDGLARTLCGTPAYVSPEILAKKAYDPASADVWSCGVVLFVMVAGYLPFNDHNLVRMYRKIWEGVYQCPKWVSPEVNHLISRILDPNPKTRITIDGILEDPWFRQGLDARGLERLRGFHLDEATKVEDLWCEDEKRDMNAFDIISLSSGCVLSGLFEEEARREVFAVAGTAEGVLKDVEEMWRRGEGVEVRRGKGSGLVVVKRGNRVGQVAVRRLDRGTVVVESDWTGDEGWEWFREVKTRIGSRKTKGRKLL